MKDVIFIAHLVKLLPGDLKGKVESKSTAAEAASYFLDNMIKPAVESGDNEPFEILLSELENSDYISLNNLAKGIRNEIHKALKAEPPTGRTGKMTGELLISLTCISYYYYYCEFNHDNKYL